MDIDYGKFISFLRRALNNLYDPGQLRRNPLAIFLGVAGRVDTPAVLQKILIEAVDHLKPGDEATSFSRAWLTHDVLYFRYVRGYSRDAVASQLGISDRQLSREQRSAIDTLSLYLWKIYHLDIQDENPTEAQVDEGHLDFTDGSGFHENSFYKGEPSQGAWVDDLPVDRTASWKPILQSVLDLLQPLMKENHVHLCYEGEDLPDLLIPQNALRQTLLVITSWLVPLAEKNSLILHPVISENEFVLSMSAQIFESKEIVIDPAYENFPGSEISRQLIEMAGGKFSLESRAGQVTVEISIPALSQVPVLVIDDNPDTIHLFQRYAQGTRYSIVGATDPHDFQSMVDKHKPQIILIDIMMPEIDGWEILTQLRRFLKNQKVSIILCSILPMGNLARTLGANGFLQKPVLPQDFLLTLDEQIKVFSSEDT